MRFPFFSHLTFHINSALTAAVYCQTNCMFQCCHFFFSSLLFKLRCCLCRLYTSGAHAEMKFQLAQQSWWKLWLFRKFNIDFNLSQRYGGSIKIVVIATTLRPTFPSLSAVKAIGLSTQISVAVKRFCSWLLPVHLRASQVMCHVCQELWWVFTSRPSLITAVQAPLNIRQWLHLRGRHAWLLRRDFVLLTPWPPHHPSSTDRPWLWPDDLL